MADQIPIKINKTSPPNNQDIKKALDLNQVLAKNAGSAIKKTSRIWILISFLLLAAALGLAAKIYLNPAPGYSQYEKFIPAQAKAVVFFKISDLKDLTPALTPALGDNESFYKWLKDRAIKFLNDNQIKGEELLAATQENAVFMVIDSSGQKVLWAAIFEVKPDEQNQLPPTLYKLQQGLRQEFGLDESFYRQAKINSVYSFNNPKKPYYYSQINNFVIISNDLNTIQQLIDKAVSR